MFFINIDEEAGEAMGIGGGNSHQLNMMNATGQAIHPGSSGPLRSADNTGSGLLNESLMSDEEHRKSKQEEEASNPRKEKSVLQAKLTKLAIQIGYGGKKIDLNF